MIALTHMASDDPAEYELVRAASLGDRAAFGELYSRYARMIHGTLLARVPAAERASVFDRFAQLVPLPPQATRESALRLDPQTLDLCWNALNLENTQWWRGWKRQW